MYNDYPVYITSLNFYSVILAVIDLMSRIV